MSVRVKSITPIRVSEEELARRRQRYRALSPEGVSLDLFNLPDGAGVPRSLDSPAAIRASERAVISAALDTDPAGYEAILPDCVLDPGLDVLERQAPVPTFGILKLSAGLLYSLGHRFASVTRNRPIGEELEARLGAYGYTRRFDRNLVLDLAFDDIADDHRWNEALKRVGEGFAGSETAAVINGCSAVEIRVLADGVALVDPTALALKMLGTVFASGVPLRSGTGAVAGG
jgi:allantoin racemase